MNKFYRIVRTAFRALRRNVMRSALTTLGIVIGVSAVIAMTEIGQGSSTAVQKTIASMGANNLLVMPGTASSGGVTFGSGSVITLTPQDADAIARECPAVNSVATVVRTRTQATFANKNWVPLVHLRHHAVVPGRARVDRPGGRRAVHRCRRPQPDAGLPGRPDHQARAVQRPVAAGPGNPHAKRGLPGHRRAQSARRQHDGHGPGRHRAGPVDEHQGPRQQQPADQRQPEQLPAAGSSTQRLGDRRHHGQLPEPVLPGQPGQRLPDHGSAPPGGLPAADALPQHRPDPGAGQHHRGDPAGHPPDHGPAARAAPHQAGPARRLRRPRHDRNVQGPGLGVRRR